MTDPQPRQHFSTTAAQYFLFTFCWSLTFWFLTVATGGISELPGSLLQYVGGAGPIIAALAIIHFRESGAIRKEFWISTFDPRRLSPPWLMCALLIHPLLVFSALIVDFALGGEFVTRTTNLTTLTSWITMLIAVFVLGPLPEEMGWRGVALDRLQAVMSPLGASLLLGAVWSVWHMPLFFIEGTFQNQLVAGSTRFWIFMITMVPLSVIMTWVYNNTNRSILSAVLIHFTGNVCGALIAKTDQLAMLELIALCIAALVIALRNPALGYQPLADSVSATLTDTQSEPGQ